MLRGPTLLLVLCAAMSNAPFQCSSKPDPETAFEETPGEAMYKLAQYFRESGNTAAWRQTLQYLIDSYPSSRFAVRAKQDLAADGGAAADAADDE